MAILSDFLKGIADAIRTRTGKTADINAQNFADEINRIPSNDSNAYLNKIISNQGSSLPALVIDDSVTTLRQYFFYSTGFTHLDIRLPRYLQKVESNAYWSNYGTLSLLDFPVSCTSVGSSAFRVSEIKKVIINNLNMSMSSGAISATDRLTDFYINGTLDEIIASGNSLVSNSSIIPTNLYYKNSDGDYMKLPDTFTISLTGNLGGFFQKWPVKNVVINEGVTKLTASFKKCSLLESVKIPNTVTSLSSCFGDCYALKELTVPASVTEMNYTFYSDQSSKMKITLIMEGSVPPTFTNVFNGSEQIEKIYVPKGARDGYINTSGWSYYKKYIVEPNIITINVPATLLNNELYQYSTDQGTTWKQFTATSFVENDISSIYFKNGTADTTILIGNTSGGSEIGTIANAQLTHNTSADEVIYLSIGA